MKRLLGLAILALAMLLAPAAALAAPAPAGTCTAVAYGDAPAGGNILTIGETDCFAFTGAAGGRPRLRVAETSGSLSAAVSVIRPNATTACGPSKSTETACTLDATGTWT